jgi:thiol-disulfide isomerase/thioredoxin
MPVFDTEFKCKIVKNGLEGKWINHYRKEKNEIKFYAVFNQSNRFKTEIKKSTSVFEGKWETTFSPDTKDANKAIGIFHHVEQTNIVHGTFLTETGDYRYLEGIQEGNELKLSCFDGSHAFLFEAKIDSSKKISGKFFSGAHWQENFTAIENKNFQLRNASEITIKKNEEKINFTFQNLKEEMISIKDKKFENKAVLVQIMGSWCPNCMDESAYLSSVYKQYNNQGLEIIALAFEKTTDIEQVKTQLTRLKNKLQLEYEILITGFTGKAKASEIFPMLNEISAFPTLLFLNKQHQIVSINTGFSGPATGKEFEKMKTETEMLIKNILGN